jgi:hypothetical protein
VTRGASLHAERHGALSGTATRTFLRRIFDRRLKFERTAAAALLDPLHRSAWPLGEPRAPCLSPQSVLAVFQVVGDPSARRAKRERSRHTGDATSAGRAGRSTMGAEDEGVTDQEERMINEEYKIWKKNTPFLYGAPLRGTSLLHRTPASPSFTLVRFHLIQGMLRAQVWCVTRRSGDHACAGMAESHCTMAPGAPSALEA